MRYEVRKIEYGNEGRWVPGELLLATNDSAAAKAYAERDGTLYELGTVIVDTVAQTADWGDHIAPLEFCV